MRACLRNCKKLKIWKSEIGKNGVKGLRGLGAWRNFGRDLLYKNFLLGICYIKYFVRDLLYQSEEACDAREETGPKNQLYG